MIVYLVQLAVCVFACTAVFYLWRELVKRVDSRLVFWIITAGVLLRAAGGQLAFWLSYLRLPFARSLQIGRGLWVFALDAIGYFDKASVAASGGIPAIVHLDKTMGSVFYVQVLATAVLLFGAVTSVALLINLAAYLGTCAVVLSFRDVAPPKAIAFALILLSFAPSVVIWSLQPLKDTTFLFLVAAVFGAAVLWQKLWSDGLIVKGIAVTLLIGALAYGVSGIRWYFGFSIAAGAVLFVVLAVTHARHRLATASAGVILIAILMFAFFAGAGPYVPPSLRNVVTPGAKTANAQPASEAKAKEIVKTLDDARDSFDTNSGATLIGAGRVLQSIDKSVGAHGRVIPATRPADDVYRTPGAKLPVSSYVPPPSATRPSNGSVPAASRAPAVAPRPEVVVPASPASRMIAGTVALVFPHVVAERLGLVNVNGGRGLWLVMDADTIVFDIALAFAVAALFAAIRRRVIGNPILWLIASVTAVIFVAVAYTVSNFGTLFRLRDMILLGLALLPVAVPMRAASGSARVKTARDEFVVSSASPSADVAG